MSNRVYGRNAFESALDGAIGSADTSITLDSTTGLTAPGFLVIEPESPTNREYIKFTGISTNTLTGVTRGADGSAAGAQSHDSGSLARMVFVHQYLDTIFTDIEALETADTDHFGGTDTSDHPEATTSVRGFMSAADKTALYDHSSRHESGGADEIPYLVPVGAVLPYAGASAPANFLLCNGQAVSRSTYADLFAIVGTTYGAGDGSTTFNVPDLRQRMVLGKAASGQGSTLGGTGGALTHTLTAAEMPSHTHSGPSHVHTMGTHVHSMPSHSHTFSDTSSVAGDHNHQTSTQSTAVGEHGHLGSAGTIARAIDDGAGYDSDVGTTTNGDHSHSVSGTTSSVDPGNTNATDPGNTNAAGTGATGSAGSGAAHENMPPYLVLNHIIKT